MDGAIANQHVQTDLRDFLAAVEEGGEIKLGAAVVPAEAPPVAAALPENVAFQQQTDAPSCSECGAIMIRNGSCYRCPECGTTSGCS